jgi:hypothetical protein
MALSDFRLETIWRSGSLAFVSSTEPPTTQTGHIRHTATGGQGSQFAQANLRANRAVAKRRNSLTAQLPADMLRLSFQGIASAVLSQWDEGLENRDFYSETLANSNLRFLRRKNFVSTMKGRL